MARTLRGSAQSSFMAQLMLGAPSYNAKNGRYNMVGVGTNSTDYRQVIVMWLSVNSM